MDNVTTRTLRYVATNNAVLTADDFAVIDATGKLVTPAATAGLKVVGRNVVSAVGDGTKAFEVKLGGYCLADNDATHAVTVAHIGTACYLVDSHTVQSDGTTAGVAGTVVGFIGTRVLVKIAS